MIGNFPLARIGVDFSDPLLWAVFIGWILSVVLHEFAHGIVAYWGGDYTVRERGGVTLNPLQYIDPVFSILIPAVIFLIGGVPLPGGVTYIRRDLIRSRAWNVAVSAAGPAMNFVLFLLCALPFHPSIELIQPITRTGLSDERLHLFLGCMAWLQMLSVLFNLVPVPPLDGYQMAEQFLPDETRARIRASGQVLFFIYFAILWQVPGLFQHFHNGVENTLQLLGFDDLSIAWLGTSYNRVLYGKM